MNRVERCDLPNEALLQRYQIDGYYADCYTSLVDGTIAHSLYIEAFYTSWLFKFERSVLRWLLNIPSSDADATALAAATTNRFSAWILEDRNEQQLLLTDFQGRTRSWLMSVPQGTAPNDSTRLYFGSAVVPRLNEKSQKLELSAVFHMLLGFHRVYSAALLRAAARRIARNFANET